MPIVKEFLSQRGLTLSEEKTKITRIEDGFDFLGQNLRKFNNKLITKPAKSSVKSFTQKVGDIIRECRGSNATKLIDRLNPVIRGWCNYHKYVQSGRTFGTIDTNIYFLLMKWGRRKHGNKTPKWIRNHYWSNSEDCKHFSSYNKVKHKIAELVRPIDIKLHRYYKIKGETNPFNTENLEYYKMRWFAKNSKPISIT